LFDSLLTNSVPAGLSPAPSNPNDGLYFCEFSLYEGFPCMRDCGGFIFTNKQLFFILFFI
jgi:hypothetical protein